MGGKSHLLIGQVMINIIGNNPSAGTLRQIAGQIITNNNIALCWGARNYRADATLVFNGVARKDAREQLTLMFEAGLTVPTWTDDIEHAKQWVRDGLRVWGRSWIHTRGTDIIGSGYKIIRNKTTRKLSEAWNPNWLKREWWVQVIPTDQIAEEWRIHIFQGRSIGRALKVQTGEPQRIQPVRNRDNGWTMVHNVDPVLPLKNAAALAVKSLGYNFGAVDLFLLNDGRIVVLEVNSAPALRSDYTMNAYKTALERIANNKWLEWRDKDFTNAD